MLFRSSIIDVHVYICKKQRVVNTDNTNTVCSGVYIQYVLHYIMCVLRGGGTLPIGPRKHSHMA